MWFEPLKKLVFIGDSITDAGRRDQAPPFGTGYVSVVRNLLVARYPSLNLNIVNRGINGNNVRDLAARWEKDAVAERPDYLSVCVGINDIWNAVYGDRNRGVPLPEYQESLRRMLKRSKDASGGKLGLILMSPFMIEPNKATALRPSFDQYADVMAKLAVEFEARFVNLQAEWDGKLRFTTPAFWSADQFHPNGPGAMVIAQAFLRAVGFEMR
jgi:lysophospholipase L1-like esterase